MYEHVYDRKVDSQRRIALPPGWNYGEVLVLEGSHELRILPKDKDGLKNAINSVPVESLIANPKDLAKLMALKKYSGLV